MAVAVLATAAVAHALDVPPAPKGPISDYANLLGADAVARLDNQLRSYELGTTRQIAVAIFPSLDDESLEDFSIRLAEKWKIGSKKNNDGVLITIFLKEHRDRIEVGYGLEGQLTDALAGRIQRELMEPKFKGGDFEGGLRAGLAAIDTATGGHEHDEGKLPAIGTIDHDRRVDDSSSLPTILGLLFFGIIFLVTVVRSIFRGRGGGGGGGGFWVGSGSGWSDSSSSWSDSGSSSGGGWSGGGGNFGGGGSSGSW